MYEIRFTVAVQVRVLVRSLGQGLNLQVSFYGNLQNTTILYYANDVSSHIQATKAHTSPHLKEMMKW